MLFNDKHVEVTVNSIPQGALIYDDGKIIGTTPAIVKIIPDKDRRLTIQKLGFYDHYINLKRVRGDARSRSGGEYTACAVDGAFLLLIVPGISAFSTYCNQFDKKFYTVDLTQ